MFFPAGQISFNHGRSSKSHSEDAVESFRCYSTECQIIDGGITPSFQFIEIHVNKPFKHILKERLANWISNGTEEFIKQSNRQRVSLEMVCYWVLEV